MGSCGAGLMYLPATVSPRQLQAQTQVWTILRLRICQGLASVLLAIPLSKAREHQADWCLSYGGQALWFLEPSRWPNSEALCGPCPPE